MQLRTKQVHIKMDLLQRKKDFLLILYLEEVPL